jgi:methanogenic corrinoid protein MtbC1
MLAKSGVQAVKLRSAQLRDLHDIGKNLVAMMLEGQV